MDPSTTTPAARSPFALPLSSAFQSAGRHATSAPWYVHAVIFATVSVIVGVLWDISWHQSIGRDTPFSPPHLAIYAGGIVAGLACGWLVLRVTFAGTPEEKASTVRFWGFRGPLAAWVCIWGAIAMITSAPFDDWWHNAYGLDVKILSPPHAVLAMGIWAIQVGAMLMVLALQNRALERDEREERLYALLFAFTAGLVLLNLATMISEYSYRMFMHNSFFYKVACGVFPLVLLAAARGSKLRWPATVTAAVYMGVTVLMMHILPLFPAEPKLAPVLYPVTHMVPPFFPLLLIVPGVAIDLVMRKWKWGRERSDWILAAVAGAVFFAAFVPAQWFFADFLLSPAARNWFFMTEKLPYMVSPTSAIAQGRFLIQDADMAARATGLAMALGIAILSSRAGLAWGSWMRRVQR